MKKMISLVLLLSISVASASELQSFPAIKITNLGDSLRFDACIEKNSCFLIGDESGYSFEGVEYRDGLQHAGGVATAIVGGAATFLLSFVSIVGVFDGQLTALPILFVVSSVGGTTLTVRLSAEQINRADLKKRIEIATLMSESGTMYIPVKNYKRLERRARSLERILEKEFDVAIQREELY